MKLFMGLDTFYREILENNENLRIFIKLWSVSYVNKMKNIKYNLNFSQSLSFKATWWNFLWTLKCKADFCGGKQRVFWQGIIFQG